MKGYRTPSWFRMKGVLKKGEVNAHSGKAKDGKPGGSKRRTKPKAKKGVG